MSSHDTHHDVEVRTCADHDCLGHAAALVAAQAIRSAIDSRGHARVMLAAAPSQSPVLTALARSDIDFSKVSFVHMDDYVGLAPDAPQGFGNWLEANFFALLTTHGAFDRIDTSLPPAQAATQYEAVLGTEPFDLTLCGLGINAHLAFNDPGARFDDDRLVRHIQLALPSRQQQVDEGHFASLADVPEHAITVTIPRLLNTRTVVCSVLGEAKRNAVAATLANEPTEEIPGTALKLHDDVHIFLDEGATPDE